MTFDLDGLCREIMALNEANAVMYRRMRGPMRPDTEAIPGRDPLDDDAVDDSGTHKLSEDAE